MNAYPRVLSESETLDRVLAGASIARFGDGEFAGAEGRSIVTQPRYPDLTARLRGILLGDVGSCLVGIPNIHSKTPKAAYWEKYKRCAVMLSDDVSYVSSFITRPDNAPWLDEPSYWRRLDALWAGKDVTLVRGGDPQPQRTNPIKLTGAVSLVASDLTSARSVTEIVGPSVDAWRVYPALMEQIGMPTTAILCLGTAATVMAVDLSRRGVHAIDAGHVGLFVRRHLKGLPMQRTTAEKVMATC